MFPGGSWGQIARRTFCAVEKARQAYRRSDGQTDRQTDRQVHQLGARARPTDSMQPEVVLARTTGRGVWFRGPLDSTMYKSETFGRVGSLALILLAGNEITEVCRRSSDHFITISINAPTPGGGPRAPWEIRAGSPGRAMPCWVSGSLLALERTGTCGEDWICRRRARGA